MNSLLYYYNNVQKMAAYRQAKRMQRGVLTAQGGFSTTDPALLQVPYTVRSVFVPNVIDVDQTVFCLASGATSPRIDILNTGNFLIYGGGQMYFGKVEQYKMYDVVFTESESEISLYIDGELIKTNTHTGAPNLYNIGFYIDRIKQYFQGDYLLHQHFNYAMSADGVKALDNNGDPMGYVVPKAMRYFPDVSFLGPEDSVIRQSYTWTNSPEDFNSFRYNFKQDILLGQRLKVQITVSDYEAGYVQLDAAFRREYYGRIDGIRANGTYVFITNALNSTAYTSYGRVWCVDEGQGRKCTVTVDSVEVVGLLAEYLPQNLMYGRDDKTIATSWLDSAKQLPLSDEYMEPLFQSIGGYDMAANGAPEILYYGLKPDSKGVTLSSASDPVKSLSLFSGPQIGSGNFTLQVHAYNTYGDLSYTGLIDAVIADAQTQTRLFALELLTNNTCNTCSVATSLLPDIGSGYPPTVGDDGIQFDMDQQAMFDKDAVLTRSGNTMSVYMNGALKATKQVSGISDLSSIVMNIVGDIQVFSLVRVFNKALTAEEVATLHNNGNPDAYVLPASMKQGDQRCVLEWLPANIIPDQNNPSTASEWLDTATVLPVGNAQPKITESVGGHDGIFQGNPTIVY